MSLQAISAMKGFSEAKKKGGAAAGLLGKVKEAAAALPVKEETEAPQAVEKAAA